MLSGNVLKSCALELAKVDAAIAAGERKATRTGGGCGQWDDTGGFPPRNAPRQSFGRSQNYRVVPPISLSRTRCISDASSLPACRYVSLRTIFSSCDRSKASTTR